MRRSAWLMMALLFVGSIFTINASGYCMAQRRFVTDNELLEMRLSSDSTAVSGRISRHPIIGHATLNNLLRQQRVWGRVAGKEISWAWLFSRPPDIDMPPQMLRFIGVYKQLVSVAVEFSTSDSRY